MWCYQGKFPSKSVMLVLYYENTAHQHAALIKKSCDNTIQKKKIVTKLYKIPENLSYCQNQSFLLRIHFSTPVTFSDSFLVC